MFFKIIQLYDEMLLCLRLSLHPHPPLFKVVASDGDSRVRRTTEAAEIARFLRTDAAASVDGGPSILFSTYDSLPKVAEAQAMSGARFELAVFDEAHVMAGRATKAMKYSFGLDDSRIALERRLFLTATPRTYRSPTAAADARGESAVTSMDNTTAFGPVVYQMSHQQVCC